MAERQTLLSQDNRSTPALRAVDVRPPAGSFGDYSGLEDIGRGIQSMADTGTQIANHQLHKIKQEADARDANDIQGRLQLALNSEGIKLQQGYTEDAASGLSNDPLMQAVNKRAELGHKNIMESMKDMRARNPKVFDRIVTPNSVAGAWSGHVDNVQRAAIGHSAVINQADRVDTAMKNDALMLTQVAAAPGSVLQVAGSVLADIDRTAKLFTPDQRHARRNQVEKSVWETLAAGSENGDPKSVSEGLKARDAGLITPLEYERLRSNYARVMSPAHLNGENRGIAHDVNEKIKGGDSVNWQTQNEALVNASATYTKPESKYNEVIKPNLLARMEGSVRSTAADGFLVANNFASAKSMLAELAKPESATIRSLFESSYQEAWNQTLQALPGMLADLKATVGMRPSEQDYGSFKTALTATLSKQAAMVDNWQVHELYKDNPGVRQAVAQGDNAALVRVQRGLYDRDQIPEDRRVYGDPAEIRALSQRMDQRDEASVNQTAKMLGSFVKKFGVDSYGALISTAQAPGPVSGVVRYMAQQFSALNRESADRIVGLMPELVQAAAWSGSQSYKAVAEKNPDFDKQTQAYWQAAFSSGYAGEFNSGAAFGKFEDGKLHSSPESSPFGNAALREGTYEGLQDIGLALTRYYVAGKKDRTMDPNKAAAYARDILGRAFIPVSTNGGANPNKTYTFAPVTTQPTDWFQPGAAGSFNNQRHYANAEAASWDSMFLTSNPKFALGGSIHWWGDVMLNGMLSGPKMGDWMHYGQLPNLDSSFSQPARAYAGSGPLSPSGSRSKNETVLPEPIDFVNAGVLMDDNGKQTFVPLSESRIVTDFLPVTVREKMTALIHEVDSTDQKGRSQVVLGNNFQREFNPKTNAWDVYLSGGRDYAGTAGTASKVGARTSVVIKQKDGTYKKLSISAQDANNRLEALMSATGYFDRPGAPKDIARVVKTVPARFTD